MVSWNRIDGVMVIASSVVYHVFELRSGHTKAYQISISALSAKRA